MAHNTRAAMKKYNSEFKARGGRPTTKSEKASQTKKFKAARSLDEKQHGTRSANVKKYNAQHARARGKSGASRSTRGKRK